MTADRSASVLARLLNRSRSTGENYNLLLSRFAIERLLYRLSVSSHVGGFVLKGALPFAAWHDTPHRPTKDVDLLGFGAQDHGDWSDWRNWAAWVSAKVRWMPSLEGRRPMQCGMPRRTPQTGWDRTIKEAAIAMPAQWRQSG